MKICIVFAGKLPVYAYGGTQRVLWYLGQELTRRGHSVTYLAGKGSYSDFARVLVYDPSQPVASQIPRDTDITHLNVIPEEGFDLPYIFNMQGNRRDFKPLPLNSIFVSRNHASRFGSDSFVYNGMDWDDYGPVQIDRPRSFFHFLAKAAWSVKNLKGAVQVIRGTPSETLTVLGGYRVSFNMGFQLTLSRRVRFKGMVGGGEKVSLLQQSKGLLFPVRWHEPFGIAITESLYFGCPVFGTPYGSLTELVTPDVGFLSTKTHELSEAITNVNRYSRQRCHEYARDLFNARIMTDRYIDKYEQVLNGASLNNERPRLQTSEPKLLPWHEVK